ncbi:hypothetical protein V8C44DRAFT_249787 [Trichoderma aethiopicum]
MLECNNTAAHVLEKSSARGVRLSPSYCLHRVAFPLFTSTIFQNMDHLPCFIIRTMSDPPINQTVLLVFQNPGSSHPCFQRPIQVSRNRMSHNSGSTSSLHYTKPQCSIISETRSRPSTTRPPTSAQSPLAIGTSLALRLRCTKHPIIHQEHPPDILLQARGVVAMTGLRLKRSPLAQPLQEISSPHEPRLPGTPRSMVAGFEPMEQPCRRSILLGCRVP